MFQKVERQMKAVELAIEFLAGAAVGAGIGWLLHGEPEKKEGVQKDAKPAEKVIVEVPSAIFIVRKDIKISKGKIAAQCGHAALGIFKKVVSKDPSLAPYWETGDFSKHYFYCRDEEDMNRVASEAESMGLKISIIQDAGRTQVAPGTITAMAIGPFSFEKHSQLTEGLQIMD